MATLCATLQMYQLWRRRLRGTSSSLCKSYRSVRNCHSENESPNIVNNSRASISDIIPLVTTESLLSVMTMCEIAILTVWELMLDTWSDSMGQLTPLPVLPVA